MSLPAVLAVDVGTSWVKALLVGRDGKPLATARTPLRLDTTNDGGASQDPEEALAAVGTSVRAALGRAAGRLDVAALTVTGQMGGVMFVAPDGTARTPWYPALDELMRPAADELEREVGDLIRELNGAAPFMAAPARWLRDAGVARPGLRPCLLTSYVVATLAGTSDALAIDRTSLTWTGLADVRAQAWNDVLAQHAGCSVADLPPIVEPGTRVGRLDPVAAGPLGLPAGTPIHVAAGDQPAALHAAGVREPGQSVDIASTYPILATATDAFRPSRRRGIDVMAGVDTGTWYVLGYLLGVGKLPDWWGQGFWPGAVAGDVDIETAAREVPAGAGGLVFAPHLSGEASSATTGRRAGILGLGWGTTPAHVYRAILEAIAFEYRALARSLAEEDAPLGRPLRAIAGGAGNTLLCSIKADVLGLDIERLTDTDVDLTLLGAASILFRVLGWDGGIERPATESIPCSPDGHRAYGPLADAYEATLAAWPRDP